MFVKVYDLEKEIGEKVMLFYVCVLEWVVDVVDWVMKFM